MLCRRQPGSPLLEIANNLWWSWNRDAVDLFLLDADLFDLPAQPRQYVEVCRRSGSTKWRAMRVSSRTWIVSTAT